MAAPRLVSSNPYSATQEAYNTIPARTESSWITEPCPPLDFNGPVSIPFSPWHDSDVDGPILARFDRIASRFADKIAVDDGVYRFTYGELWSSARHLARQIEDAVPAGRPVAVLLANSALFPLAALGCLAAGRPYMPLDASYPAKRNAEIVHSSGAGALILDSGNPQGIDETLRGFGPQINISASLGMAGGRRIGSQAGSLIILHTSGSSGRPKGVVNTPANILDRVRQYTNSAHINPEDGLMLLISHATIAGMRETFAALLNGATLYIADLQKLGIGGVLRVLCERPVSLFYSVPSVLRALVSAEGTHDAFRRLRVIRLGGDIAFASDVALFQHRLPASCSILSAYSSTEVPTVFQWFVREASLGDSFRLPAGYLVEGTAVALVNDEGEPAGIGEIGEVVVKSRYLALGLWLNGTTQTDATTPDPGDPSLRIWHTGDLASLRSDGLFELHGRNDRQIKINGVRIDPSEVEAALRDCSGIADAAVIPQKTGDQTALVGYVVARNLDPKPSVEELKTAIAVRVPRAMHPARIHFLDEIPRLPGFKPDVRRLADLGREFEDQGPLATFTTDRPPEVNVPANIREAVQTTWSAILGAESFAKDAPWNESGGDSLRQVVLLFNLEGALKCRLSPEVLAPGMRPSRLSAAIAQFLSQDDDVDERLPLVHLFPGILGDEPGLAQFRAALRGRVRFRLMEYPDQRSMMGPRICFDSVVDHAIKQLRVDGQHRVNLAGYSFGGFVAFEVARRLRDSGQSVGLVGLLDPAREAWLEVSSVANLGLKKLFAKVKGIELQHDLIRLCVRLRALRTLRCMGWLVERLGNRLTALRFSLRVTESLRQEGLRDWEIKPLSGPATLFRSQEVMPGLSNDLGWQSLCESLEMVPVAGGHRTMIESSNIPSLSSVFFKALQESQTRSDPAVHVASAARHPLAQVG
jgi:acyl-CoA synthetase (AMP-forming)/AMP-acid ligase II/thioesterase domain-containing protein